MLRHPHLRRLSLLPIAVFAITLAGGCGGGGHGGRPRGDLTGIVSDADGRPVVGAYVAAGSSSTTSLSNGTFVLTGIKEGYVQVVASTDVSGHRWSGETLVDLVGDYQNRSTNVVVSDERYQASLGGTVIDPNGFPLEGAKVFIQGPYGSTLAVADRDGNYVAERLAPTQYAVTASLAGYKNDTRTITLTPNQAAALSFALSTGSNLGTLPAPTGVTTQTWTIADTVNRSVAQNGQNGRNGLDGRKRDIYDWLQHLYRTKRGLPEDRVAKIVERKSSKPTGRLTPVGSVIEVDLFWTYQSDPQLFGYAIKRAQSQASLPGADVTAVLRDPLASAFFDNDFLLTPDTKYYYSVHRLDTVTFPATGAIGAGSTPVSADPFAPISALSPVRGQSVSGTPVFTWTPVNGAAAYQIYVWDAFPSVMPDSGPPLIWPSDPGNPGTALITAPATSTTYKGPALTAGHTYYWLVAALDTTNPNNVGTISASQIAKFVKR